jgi:hypothetical protein
VNAVLENPDRVWTYEGYSGLNDEACFEIISPTSLRRDRYDKRDLSARFGVKEFWLADPANQSVEVLCLEEAGYRLLWAILRCPFGAGECRAPRGLEFGRFPQDSILKG